jgi:glycine dehydrogenase subunit 2
MNQRGRPTQPGEATPIRRRTFTGNRALDMEEALIFESGRFGCVEADIKRALCDRP